MQIRDKRRIVRTRVDDPWEVILVKDNSGVADLNLYKVLDYSDYGFCGRYIRTGELRTKRFKLTKGEEVKLNGFVSHGAEGKRIRVAWTKGAKVGFEFFN